jgi:hypothetical protein
MSSDYVCLGNTADKLLFQGDFNPNLMGKKGSPLSLRTEGMATHSDPLGKGKGRKPKVERQAMVHWGLAVLGCLPIS